MKIELGEGQLQEIVSEAILRTVDAEQRDLLLRQAIQHLITPQPQAYDRGPAKSPLQEAFQTAIQGCALQLALEFFRENAEARAQVQQAIVEGYRRFVGRLADGKLYDAIAERMVSAFDRERY